MTWWTTRWSTRHAVLDLCIKSSIVGVNCGRLPQKQWLSEALSTLFVSCWIFAIVSRYAVNAFFQICTVLATHRLKTSLSIIYLPVSLPDNGGIGHVAAFLHSLGACAIAVIFQWVPWIRFFFLNHVKVSAAAWMHSCVKVSWRKSVF